MDDTREVTQNRQEDIDQEVAAAATLEEYAERRQNDGNDDLADVAEAQKLASRSRSSHS